jgi:predicted amidohydrolase YtcJ
MSIRSFKIVSDGALGSRGACLKAHYSDDPSITGKLLFTPSQLDSLVALMYDVDYQVNTHCIGDSANAAVLRIYGKYLEQTNDLRWRIEHAQVMDPADIAEFAKYSIIPSVQPTHAVSDMPWAMDRLGKRIKGAYLFKTLLQQNGIIALGTDFPVEEINPFKTFYAAVTRKYYDGKPIEGLEKELLTREEALMGMTKWAASAAFLDKETGTIEKGKWADIIILDRDILKVEESQLLNTLVIETIINGKRVHSLE